MDWLLRWRLSHEEKVNRLIRWYEDERYRQHKEFLYIDEERFDREYKKLFGKYPKWYSWEGFHRDHGLVVRESIKTTR